MLLTTTGRTDGSAPRTSFGLSEQSYSAASRPYCVAVCQTSRPESATPNANAAGGHKKNSASKMNVWEKGDPPASLCAASAVKIRLVKENSIDSGSAFKAMSASLIIFG